MSRRVSAHGAAVTVAVEAAMDRLVHDLEGIKALHELTDAEIAVAIAKAPTVAEYWLEWRRRQAPLTEQLPIIRTESIGDLLDL
jgi:hypothetical protein